MDFTNFRNLSYPFSNTHKFDFKIGASEHTVVCYFHREFNGKLFLFPLLKIEEKYSKTGRTKKKQKEIVRKSQANLSV